MGNYLNAKNSINSTSPSKTDVLSEYAISNAINNVVVNSVVQPQETIYSTGGTGTANGTFGLQEPTTTQTYPTTVTTTATLRNTFTYTYPQAGFISTLSTWQLVLRLTNLTPQRIYTIVGAIKVKVGAVDTTISSLTNFVFRTGNAQTAMQVTLPFLDNTLISNLNYSANDTVRIELSWSKDGGSSETINIVSITTNPCTFIRNGGEIGSTLVIDNNGTNTATQAQRNRSYESDITNIKTTLLSKLETSNIKAGSNVTVSVSGNDVTINSSGGGSSDYTTLTNKPQINSVTLEGNKALVDLGIQSSTDVNLQTTDKTVAGAINELDTTFKNAIVTPNATYSTPSVWAGTNFNNDNIQVIESIIKTTSSWSDTNFTKTITIQEDGYYTFYIGLRTTHSAPSGPSKINTSLVKQSNLIQTIVSQNATIGDTNTYTSTMATINCIKGDIFSVRITSGLPSSTTIYDLFQLKAVRVYSPFDLNQIEQDIDVLKVKDITYTQAEATAGLTLLDNQSVTITNPTTINITSASGIGLIQFIATTTTILLPSGQGWDGFTIPVFILGKIYQVIYNNGTWYSSRGR